MIASFPVRMLSRLRPVIMVCGYQVPQQPFLPAGFIRIDGAQSYDVFPRRLVIAKLQTFLLDSSPHKVPYNLSRRRTSSKSDKMPGLCVLWHDRQCDALKDVCCSRMFCVFTHLEAIPP